MMLVFWVITPLQSAILGTGVVQRTSAMTIITRSQLIPVSEQKAKIAPELLTRGYSIGWLNQTCPQFMTPEYVLLPYYVDGDPAPEKSQANWTATTTKLSVDLVCRSANISRRGSTLNPTYYYSDGQGCEMKIDLPYAYNGNTTYKLEYVGYYGSAYSDYALAYESCPATPDSIHRSLAVWARGFPIGVGDPTQNITSWADYNVTALFCQTHYYKQDFTVTVDAKSKVPFADSFQPVSTREVLTVNEFNSTAFEFLIANGMSEGAEGMAKDKPFSNVIEQNARVSGYGLIRPFSAMVGFVLAGQNKSLDAYGDPQVLEKAFDRAAKYLFTATVSRILANTTDFRDHAACSTYPLSGIIVSRAFSTAVEALLVACAVLTLALLWLCRRAPCHLRSNPNSISRLTDIFRNSPDILAVFGKLDNANGKSLSTIFRQTKFRLSRFKDVGGYKLRLELKASTYDDDAEGNAKSPEAYYDPIRPFALTRTMGVMFVGVMLGALATIAWLKSAETSQNGSPLTLTLLHPLLLSYQVHRADSAIPIVRGTTAARKLHPDSIRNLGRTFLGNAQPAHLRHAALPGPLRWQGSTGQEHRYDVLGNPPSTHYLESRQSAPPSTRLGVFHHARRELPRYRARCSLQ